MTPLKTTEFPLIGPAGEPVDFNRTINGHGVTSLPPMIVDEAGDTLTVTLALPSLPPRTVTLSSQRQGIAEATVHGASPSDSEMALVLSGVRYLLRLDQDLSAFYARAADDPELSWATRGAGRMTRCQTAFEDVVKTICTTNCAWSATVRMTNALVQHLGARSPDAPSESWEGRAFPTPAAMAAADDQFYREVARCGYRGAYLRKLAQSVADGAVDLESLAAASPDELPDDEMALRLQALPGVGPYAAAHIMMMLGRYSRLILDSWTRPAYAKIAGVESIPDDEIVARFAPFGEYAGLAFWLFVTRQWIDDDESPSQS